MSVINPQQIQFVSNSATPTGNSAPIPINLRNFKAGVGLLVTFSSNASGGCTVQVTGDQLGNKGPVLNTWNNHDILQNLTASQNSSLAYPCSAVRLVVTSLSSTNGSPATITLSVVQAV